MPSLATVGFHALPYHRFLSCCILFLFDFHATFLEGGGGGRKVRRSS